MPHDPSAPPQAPSRSREGEAALLSSRERAFDALAADWHRRHGAPPLRRLAAAWRTRRLLRLLPHRRQARVLDVGCGVGDQLLALAPHIREGVGIDASPVMIAEARRRARHANLCFRHLPIEHAAPEVLGRFALILFVASLEHMAVPEAALATASRLLAADGRIAVVMPHPAHPRSLWARRSARRGRIPPFRHLSPGALAALARASGLRPVRRSLAASFEELLARAVLGSYLAVFERAPPGPSPVDRESSHV